MLVTIALWSRLGLTGYALALTAGAAATTVALVVLASVSGSLPRPSFAVHAEDWRPLLRHALPLTGGYTVLPLNPLVQRLVASFLAPGAISALRYGDIIIRAPLYAAGPAWNAVAYPVLADSTQRGEQGLGSTAEAATRYAVAVFVPLTFGFAAFSPLIVDVVLARGAFGHGDAQVTSLVVAGFAPLLLVQALQPIFLGLHNARRHGALMGAAAVVGMAATAAFSALLGFSLGVGGLALGVSAAALLMLAILASRADEPGFSRRRVLATLLPVAAVSAVLAIPAGVAAWYLHGSLSWPADLALAFIGGLVAVVAYVVIARSLGIAEVIRLTVVGRRWAASRLRRH